MVARVRSVALHRVEVIDVETQVTIAAGWAGTYMMGLRALAHGPARDERKDSRDADRNYDVGSKAGSANAPICANIWATTITRMWVGFPVLASDDR
jgi:hypothetical protein